MIESNHELMTNASPRDARDAKWCRLGYTNPRNFLLAKKNKPENAA